MCSCVLVYEKVHIWSKLFYIHILQLAVFDISEHPTILVTYIPGSVLYMTTAAEFATQIVIYLTINN